MHQGLIMAPRLVMLKFITFSVIQGFVGLTSIQSNRGPSWSVLEKVNIRRIQQRYCYDSQYNNHKQPRMQNADSNDSIDPEFLTFRHNNAVANSGRSIYSQRFDYKSLEKYQIFDSQNSERVDPISKITKNTKVTAKDKQIRNVKSHDKYKDILMRELGMDNEIDDCENEYSGNAQPRAHKNSERKRDRTPKKQTEVRANRSGLNARSSNKINTQQITEKNQELKAKLARLSRNIKKQQRKQLTLSQEIHQIEAQLEQQDKEIEEQLKGIQELSDINQENMKQCNKIINHIEAISEKNDQLAANLENLEESVDSSGISIETTRQDGVRDRALCSQLKEGISELLKLRADTQGNIGRLEQEILGMQHQIEQMRVLECELARVLGLADLSGSGSHQFSQVYSHGSSRASHSEDRLY